MGKLVTTILFLFVTILSSAQSNRSTFNDTLNIILNPQIEAKFQNSNRNLKKFIQRNIDSSIYEKYYNSFKQLTKKSYITSVFVQTEITLIVDKLGRIYNVDIETKSPQFLKDEIERLLLLSQPWKPALNDNVPVASKKKFVMEFALHFSKKFRQNYFETIRESSANR